MMSFFQNTLHLIALAFLGVGVGLFVYGLRNYRKYQTNRSKLLITLAVVVMMIAPYLVQDEIYNALSVSPADQISRHIIETLAWVVFGYLVIRALRVFLWEEIFTVDGELLIPRFIVHGTNFLVFFVVALFYLHFVGDRDVTALAAGAGALAIGIGYLAQNPLQSIFAGLSFSLSPMFRKGDFLQVETTEIGEFKGTVVDMGWLHVTLKTKEGHYVHIQNLLIEKSIVSNFTHPVARPSFETEITLEYEFPMAKSLMLINEAIKESGLGISQFTVAPERFGRFGITYLIRFSLKPKHNYHDVIQAMLSSIYYRIQKEQQFDFGYDKFNSLHSSLASEKDATLHHFSRHSSLSLAQKTSVLRAVDIFESLSNEDTKQLAQSCNVHRYGPPELIIRQGDKGDSMFIVVDGHVRVSLMTGDESVDLATHGPGKYFGEMAVLTGQLRGANVIAVDDVHLLEIPKDGLRPILEKTPELVGRIADSVAKMQSQNEALSSAAQARILDRNARTISRSEAIRESVLRFFGLDFPHGH